MRLCGDVQKEIDRHITGDQIANGGTITQKLSSSLLKLEEATVARSLAGGHHAHPSGTLVGDLRSTATGALGVEY
jgi:hypothetical protein